MPVKLTEVLAPPQAAITGQRIVLGIDPGSRIMGYGVVSGSQVSRPNLVAAGAIDFTSIPDHHQRLASIHQQMLGLLERFRPTEMAIEAPFYGKNAQSMLKLGRAQGVAIAAGISRELSVEEYAPLKVKLAVTGHGEASKEQVMGMLDRQFPGLGLTDLRFKDATDALAVALCHFYQGGIVPRRGASSWAKFIERHPNRVIGPERLR